MAFDLSQYETVESRITRFYEQFKNGRIITELIAYSDNAFIVKAFVYRNDTDTNPASTGFAEEKVGSSPVNRTSALENCETSAIGRALANLNFAPKGARPTVEEMTKTNRYEVANGDVPREEWKKTARGEWADVRHASEKQIKFVKNIVADAFKSTGLQDEEKSWNYIGEWLNTHAPIAKAEDLDGKMASIIINDKMNNKPLSKLIEFLQSKISPDHDPWKSPANF